MDFSGNGGDSWDSTPGQEKFIQNFFRGKEPQRPSTTGTKNFVKKTKERSCPEFVVSDNFQKAKSNKKSLKNKPKRNDLTKKCVQNVHVDNDSAKSSLLKDNPSKKRNLKKRKPNICQTSEIQNKLSEPEGDCKIKRMEDSAKGSLQKDNNPSKKRNLKKRKPNICQTSEIQNKLSKPEGDCKIKRMKDSKNTLKPKENYPSTDESGDSDEDELIRNELQNTPMFKKIQKLMKLSPHFNPNFTEGMEADNSSCEDVSVEEWSSEIDEDLSDSVMEVVKSDNKNSAEELSESDAEDLPYKKASSLSQSASSQVQKKLKRSPGYSSSNDKNVKKSNSQLSEEVFDTSHIQQSSILMSSPLTSRNPSKLRANEKAIRSSAFIEKARAKLASAKFRFLNEKLYTETGEDAFTYFQENTEEFEDYHLGYGMQVSKWPLNPVDEIISDLQKSNKDVVIADMGCGDAKIARVLTNKKVHSFDLVAMQECVTACNISRVPLPDSNVDVVVFCLSLMGVNLVDYLQEAYRILKLGGSLKIAEVESRIENLDLFIKNLNSLGFVLEKKNTKNKLFVFLDLKKVKKGKASKAPTITLRPCLYKKR